MEAPSLNRSLAKGIVLHWGGTPANQLDAMRMLGLIAEDDERVDGLRSILPDDNRIIEIDSLNDKTFDRDGINVPDPRIRDFVPEGLLNFNPRPPAAEPAPPKPKPKAKSKAKPKPTPTAPDESLCGTRRGRWAHRKRGEPLCDPCKAAQATYKREYAARRRAEGIVTEKPDRVGEPQFCGTPTGRKQHQRYGEQICDPCRLDHNRRTRANYAKKHPQEESPARGQHLKPVPQVPNQLDMYTGEERSA